MDLGVDVATFASTRAHLHRVAVHVVSRARVQATGRFSLRVTPGGFGTPEFGDDLRRVRVSGQLLVVEADAPGASSMATHGIDGSSLAALAGAAGVDLAAALDVGHDTPPTGDRDAPLLVDAAAADALARWYALVQRALEEVVGSRPRAVPSAIRLWPEHFDVAIDLAARDGVRANVGGSAGDGFCDEPYLYVGPWTTDRPGSGDYWNAPFGAFRPASAITGEPVDATIAFFTEGLDRLAEEGSR